MTKRLGGGVLRDQGLESSNSNLRLLFLRVYYFDCLLFLRVCSVPESDSNHNTGRIELVCMHQWPIIQGGVNNPSADCATSAFSGAILLKRINDWDWRVEGANFRYLQVRV
ncbi:hypothetical protein BRADI_2g61215v3 [Brachypodium distachyon]|uniref:Uncharacterized protein n=1 Tax=Brachypodium distachyon TaxID=15368 RepID=A0A2K2DH56_BRADI|nr:hypothetical protein BRADI_2g61215v3 [Brachypodium distachyon]